jgi:Flp pilus assembly protein TadD
MLIHHLKGEMGEAYRLARSEVEKNPEDLNAVAFLGMYAAAAGDRDVAMRAERRLREMAAADSTDTWSSLLGRAAIAAHLGERERAVELLGQTLELQFFWDLHLHPAFEPLGDYEAYRRLTKPKG